jgi:GTP-binding protein EngB required for normal cell division
VLESYVEIRNLIIANLEDIHGLVTGRNNQRAAKSARELIEKLSEGQFNLAVLGQFKRGKTTLINALLGSKLLPTAVIPLTSIITLIKYGNKLRIEVFFKDGGRGEITLEELPDYVTERGNPENRRGVQYVEVLYDSPYLRDGVRIIDTPGIGSTYEHNTALTYSYLSKVDAAVFLVGVDPPFSRVEYDFLNDIRKYVGKIFFLQNKIDQVDEKDRAESLEFTKRVIEEKVGLKNVKIFPVSAKRALEEKLVGDQDIRTPYSIRGFETALNDFLIEEKGRTFLCSALGNALKIISDETISVELEMKALSIPLEELTGKICEFNVQMRKIRQDKDDFDYLLRGEKERLVTLLEADLKHLVESKAPELVKTMGGHYQQHKDKNKTELTKAIDSAMKQEIESIFDEWRILEEEKLGREFEKIAGRFSSRANEIIIYIKKLSSDIFEIDVDAITGVEALTAESYFYYKVESLFDTALALEFLPFALPGFLFRKLALKRMLEQSREELDRNAGRSRFDFIERIDKSLKKFRDELFFKIDATLSGIESVLERAAAERTTGEEEVMFGRKNLEEQLGILKRISMNLKNIELELKT